MTAASRRPHLSRQLVLEDPRRLPDGAGGYVESWSALGTLWAEVTAKADKKFKKEVGT